ncbi:hypothetical protein [Shewanella marina]|uniref:hypothetical protein n=1 Tax=Shewanella marina TaxID=487319 RepID=UPI00055FFDFE|nr:hypothetical protein [Shewanella marina]
MVTIFTKLRIIGVFLLLVSSVTAQANTAEPQQLSYQYQLNLLTDHFTVSGQVNFHLASNKQDLMLQLNNAQMLKLRINGQSLYLIIMASRSSFQNDYYNAVIIKLA